MKQKRYIELDERMAMINDDDVNGMTVSNNKNSKYLTSALAICWEEHSLPFHYQPTTPCRRMQNSVDRSGQKI